MNTELMNCDELAKSGERSHDRHALASAIKNEADAKARFDTLRESQSRLLAVSEKVAAAEAEIATIRADDAAAMLAWSKGPDDVTMPMPSARLGVAYRDLAALQQSATGAAGAVEAIDRELIAAGETVNAANQARARAVLAVLREQGADIADHAHLLAIEAQRLRLIAQTLGAEIVVEQIPDVSGHAMRVLGDLRAPRPVPVDMKIGNVAANAWLVLAEQLQTDPDAVLNIAEQAPTDAPDVPVLRAVA